MMIILLLEIASICIVAYSKSVVAFVPSSSSSFGPVLQHPLSTDPRYCPCSNNHGDSNLFLVGSCHHHGGGGGGGFEMNECYDSGVSTNTSGPQRQQQQRRLLSPTALFQSLVEDSSDPIISSSKTESNELQQVNGMMHRRPASLPTVLLMRFWKGITFPFPQLRALTLESQQQQQQSKMSAMSSAGLSIRECFMAIGIYLAIGVTLYTTILEPHWSILDALYFCVVSFTTVGYGDLCPSSSSVLSKLVTCVYGLAGVACLGTVIATIGSSVVAAEMAAMAQAAQRASRRRLFQRLDQFPNKVKVLRAKQIQKRMERQQRQQQQQKQQQPQASKQIDTDIRANPVLPVLAKLVPSFLLLILGGIGMGRLEGWGWVDSIYYSLITAGTLGYGDYAPQTKYGRLYAALFFIPLAVAAAGEVLSGIASIWLDRKQQAVVSQVLERPLSADYLDEMDLTRDGRVSKVEFVEFMLLQLQLVEKDQLQEIMNQFERLDVTKSGYLDQKDLKLVLEMQQTSSHAAQADESEAVSTSTPTTNVSD